MLTDKQREVLREICANDNESEAMMYLQKCLHRKMTGYKEKAHTYLRILYATRKKVNKC